ncbi:hypothetical protein HMPREF0208_02616 [Citrobacter koseri]|nr:hypothetical protein HMPREF3220_02929 [Citrobacter koseri]KXB43365.1 hypothetical protein HMPREF0208_02616 [Citrobacter koseri]
MENLSLTQTLLLLFSRMILFVCFSAFIITCGNNFIKITYC